MVVFFSPFTIGVLASKLRSSGLAGSAFTHLVILTALLLAFSLSLECISGIKSCNNMPSPIHQPMLIVFLPIHKIWARITVAILTHFSVRTQNKMKLSLDLCQESMLIISAGSILSSNPATHPTKSPIPCSAGFPSGYMFSHFNELYHCACL